MSPPPTPAIVVSPLLHGLIVSCPLFGVSLAQTLYYYRAFDADRLRIKLFVASLIVLDVAHTMCIIHGTYHWYLQADLIFVLPNSVIASGFIAYTVISLVQTAYAMRVWHMSDGNKWLVAIIILSSLSQMICGYGMNINLSISSSIISIHHQSSEVFGGIQLAASVLCDVLITTSLVFYLNRHRGSFKRTQNIVDRLIVYSINIGLVTSALSLVAMITWFAMPQNFIFTTFHVLISKVYVNSLLVSLNSRESVKGDVGAFEIDSGLGSDLDNIGVTMSTFRVETSSLDEESRFPMLSNVGNI